MTYELNERALLGAATAALNARRAANGWPPTSPDKMMTADRDAWIEDARAAITAYQAEAWQPISTAPKDGARVLLYPSPYYASNGSVGWFAKKAKDWAYEGETGTGCIPTHWQPLPKAPGVSP